MQRIKALRYSAQIGEQITLAVTPIGVGVFVAAALDGAVLKPEPGSPNAPRYEFEITGPVGTSHFVEMEFSFPQAGAGAKYSVNVSGSNGGSDSFTVSKNDAVKDKGLRFKATA